MIKDILIYPNPILRQKSKPVEEFDDVLHQLLDDLSETMEHYGGVGLASVQIGVPKAAFIINIPVKDENDEDIIKKENLIEVINPQIISQDGEQVFSEGCLSVPGYTTEIKRAKTIQVKYQDRYGNHISKKFYGYMAVAWLHECEHLSGRIFVENLNFTDRKKFEKNWKKKKKKKKNEENKNKI
ncbi:MAG: peptide deformylase [Epsilonproteobacteria bacterium]|nr:MAG: peptide deformylase [Campylobacterota bacterium]